MTNPVQSFRRTGQAHKTKGSTGLDYEGAYTAEAFKFANVAAGTTELVAAVAAKKIRVLSYSLSGVTAGVSTSIFKSATNAISHTISLAANGNSSEADNNGLFETAAGEALNLTVATNTVGVRLTYILVN